MRVDEDLLELTQEVARQHGWRYQAVIRLWIEEGLRRAIQEGVEDPDPSPVVPVPEAERPERPILDRARKRTAGRADSSPVTRAPLGPAANRASAW